MANALRARLRSGEWDHDGRLPTEAQLCREFGVSRVTARQAVKLLESQGLVETRQGVGTLITTSASMVHAGLQELKSITATIREMGYTPSMEYRSKHIGDPDRNHIKDFGQQANTKILSIRRTISADGTVVAFCEDSLPLWAMGPDFTTDMLTGSVYGFLAEHTDVRPRRAVAEIHPRNDLPSSWDHDEAKQGIDPNTMFLLLDQLQFDDRNRPFMRTRAHFVDGRFSFVVLRLA